MRILVVDDEPAVREAVDRALRVEGYDTELAADGTEALDAVPARVEGLEHSLELCVGNLRRKLEADGEPRLIPTVRGLGYVLRER